MKSRRGVGAGSPTIPLRRASPYFKSRERKFNRPLRGLDLCPLENPQGKNISLTAPTADVEKRWML